MFLTPSLVCGTPKPTPQVAPCLSPPDVMEELDSRIAPAYNIGVDTRPTPVAFRPTVLPADSFADTIVCSEEEAATVEKVMRGQSTNVEWYHQKMGCIGGSICGQILRYQERGQINPKRLVYSVMGYKYRYMTAPNCLTGAA